MRVVLLHESPGADALAGEFTEAAREFNRGLDIRLRFLDVGFELRTLSVPAGERAPAVRLDEILGSFRPGVVLALGRGPGLLECVAVAAKARAPVAFHPDGVADRSARAIARLAEIVVETEGCGLPAAAPGSRRCALPAGTRPGPALVDILVRLVREGRRP